MAYKQWIEIILHGAPHKTMHVRNAFLKWGKFYRHPDKDAELSPAQINELTLDPAHNRVTIASCGRSDAASGTEGGFELQTANGGVIARCTWDCPWGTAANTFTWHHVGTGYSAHIKGERLVPFDSENFSTPENPELKRLEERLENPWIPDEMKRGDSIKFLISPETPGPLGEIHVRLMDDGKGRVVFEGQKGQAA